jgi:hypothetical protein
MKCMGTVSKLGVDMSKQNMEVNVTEMRLLMPYLSLK